MKSTPDKLLSMTAVVAGHLPLACLTAIFAPLPSAASLPYLITGAALHTGYQTSLLLSYGAGDLSHVYPIARGSAPLLVAGVSVFVLGMPLSGPSVIGVVVIGIGIVGLAFVRGSEGLHNPRATIMALITGCFIAAYSLVDGLGAREAGTAFGFFAWLAILNAIVFASIGVIIKPGLLGLVARDGRVVLVVGGSASFIAYSLVVWAFTLAPIALVTALRESSIIFALVIGVFFLREKLNLAKVFATVLTLSGVVLLRIAP